MKDIYITWEDYHKKIEQLAKKVHEDNLKFNQIICIAKGGLRVDRLFIKEASVGKAITMRRFRPRARGRTGRIRKPFSHLTVIVSERQEAV